MCEDDWTAKEEERQDIVDNAIFELISELVPLYKTSYEWDIEDIAEIREAVQKVVVEKRELMTEQEFYPYREIGKPVTTEDWLASIPDDKKIFVTDEQISTAVKNVIDELDGENFGAVAGEMLGGSCWWVSEDTYVFIPDEFYGGAFDSIKKIKN